MHQLVRRFQRSHETRRVKQRASVSVDSQLLAKCTEAVSIRGESQNKLLVRFKAGCDQLRQTDCPDDGAGYARGERLAYQSYERTSCP